MNVVIPDHCLLSPSDRSAVVGGNVLTCQRIVDVVFKAFRTCAGSQGCMNNITFGDENVGYYETVAAVVGAVSDTGIIGLARLKDSIAVGSWVEWKKWHSHTHDKYKNNRSRNFRAKVHSTLTLFTT